MFCVPFSPFHRHLQSDEIRRMTIILQKAYGLRLNVASWSRLVIAQPLCCVHADRMHSMLTHCTRQVAGPELFPSSGPITMNVIDDVSKSLPSMSLLQ